MKQLFATAGAHTQATLERCFDLVVAVDRYPSWYPATVRGAEVTERDADGLPVRGHVDLHVQHGFLVRDFHIDVSVVTRRLESVELARIPHHAGDNERLSVAWALTGGEQTEITVRMDANLSIPGFLPTGGLAESVAQGFLDAALAALS